MVRLPSTSPAAVVSTDQGRAARDRAIAGAQASRGADWDRKVIDQALAHLAASGREFTADDLRELLPVWFRERANEVRGAPRPRVHHALQPLPFRRNHRRRGLDTVPRRP